MRQQQWGRVVGTLLMAAMMTLAYLTPASGSQPQKSTEQSDAPEVAPTTASVPVAERFKDHTRSIVKFVTLEHAAFRYDLDCLQLELYSSIVRDFLGFEPAGDGIQNRYEISFQVRTPEDSVLIESSWERTNWAQDSSAVVKGMRIPELIRYVLYPGTYRVACRVDDIVSGTYYSEEYTLQLKQVVADTLASSDILFASRIEKAQGDVGEFDHNGLLVLPNAERMYGDATPQLFYYIEYYNLSVDGQYKTFGRVLTAEGEEVRPLRSRTRPTVGAFLVEVDAFSVATLRTGGYTLELTVIDEAVPDTLVVSRDFWVYREAEQLASDQLQGNPGFDVAALTETELNEELAMLRPILTDRARRLVMQLKSIESKRRFLTGFWSNADTDPATPANEFRQMFMQRLEVVNYRYASFGRNGWQTDRGRVYLMYGAPDVLDDFPFDHTVQRAYQIWYYDSIEGGVEFVFVDRTNLGDYVQVHSTKRGELNNRNWAEQELR